MYPQAVGRPSKRVARVADCRRRANRHWADNAYKGPYVAYKADSVRPRARELLLYLFDELACVGFGADVGIGKGAFGFPNGVPELEPVDLFQSDRRSGDKTLIVLSTFQPGPEDPTRGVWESFVKFG